jgi:glycine/D-amino acid oxidase-like deaminating enzyme
VVGAGVVGLSIAWLLQRQDHAVRLLDPCLNGPPAADSGSWAALGVLMGQVFHRSSGRGWRLRQRSLELWREWIAALEAQGHSIPYRPGLLLLASDGQELERHQRLCEERQTKGFPLELWEPAKLQNLQPHLPKAALGGLYSPADGQLDPAMAMAALRADAERHGLIGHAEEAVAVERHNGQWRIHCSGGTVLKSPWLVLSAGVRTAELIEPLGHALPMEPVLGQALELELTDQPNWQGPDWEWPGAVVWRGVNLVPRPDLQGGKRLWLGATLEPGTKACPETLAALRDWGNSDLDWLDGATALRQWQGHRPRPSQRPAPLLEQLEPGLILASGHYRNGVLLAPATAEWVAQVISERDANSVHN